MTISFYLRNFTVEYELNLNIKKIIHVFNDMKLGEYIGFCYDLAIGSPSVLVNSVQ